MNKKIIGVLLVVMVFVLAAGCGKKNTKVTEATTEIATETTEPLIPGVEKNDFSEDDFEQSASQITENTVPEETVEENAPDKETTESTKSAQATTPNNPTDSTKPTDSANSTEATEATEPEETTKPTTDNNQQSEGKEPSAYETYMAMSGAEQQAFIESFDSMEAFFVWLNNARAEDEAQKDVIIVEDGVIDLDSLAG